MLNEIGVIISEILGFIIAVFTAGATVQLWQVILLLLGVLIMIVVAAALFILTTVSIAWAITKTIKAVVSGVREGWRKGGREPTGDTLSLSTGLKFLQR